MCPNLHSDSNGLKLLVKVSAKIQLAILFAPKIRSIVLAALPPD